jgi:hypothetical protein
MCIGEGRGLSAQGSKRHGIVLRIDDLAAWNAGRVNKGIPLTYQKAALDAPKPGVGRAEESQREPLAL